MGFVMSEETERLLKFFLVFCCFINTFYAKNGFILDKKDRYSLRVAAGFTLAADFLMVLFDYNVSAIFVFCLAQAAYNYRFTNIHRVKTQFIIGIIVFVLAYFITGRNALSAAAAAYTVFILYSLTGSIIAYNYFPHPSRVMIVVGMLLFMACDIAVLLYNSPFEFLQSPAMHNSIGQAIWIFYLPSQVLLSSSSKNIPELDDKNKFPNTH